MNATTACVVDGCAKPREKGCRDKCGAHYAQQRRGTLPTTRPTPVGPGPWALQALCRSREPELFFPVSEALGNPDVQLALSICTACPVARSCLEWALDNQPDGIAGGLTSAQRRDHRTTTTVHHDIPVGAS